MKRYRMGISAFLLYAILTGSVPVFAQQAATYQVYVNGVVLSGAHPMLRDGVAYLPANTLAQALGVSIQWDARLNVVKVNDEVTSARPLNENGSLMLPIEAVATALNGSVEWDGRNNAIRISSKPSSGGPAVAVAPTPATRPIAATPKYPRTTVPVSTYPTSPASKTPTIRTVPITRTPVVVTGPTVAVSPSGPAVPPVSPGVDSVQYPSPSAYPPTNTTSSPLRPMSAGPKMPAGLELPTPGTENGPPVQSATAYGASGGVYVPKTTQNNVFAVTVTNIENVSSIKDFYHPRAGYRFVVVYLSQQNVSNEVQIYTGRFSVLDQNNRSYDYIEGLSNFWLVILRPYGINFGYLVFEMPTDAHPTRLALHALNQSPLTLNL